MDTPSPVLSEPIVEISPARHWSQRMRGRGRTLAIGIGLVLILCAGGYALRKSGLYSKMMDRAASGDPSLYVVRPTPLSITLTEDGELKPKNSVDIKCELEGQSTILWVVEESTLVKKDDLLVELASDEIKEKLQSEEIELLKMEAAVEGAQRDLELTLNENASKIAKAEVSLQIAKLELERYRLGDYEKSLKAAKLSIEQSKMDIERRRDELNKNLTLQEKGFVTRMQIEQLEFELRKAEMTLEQNELALFILEAYEKLKNETQKQLDVTQAGEEYEREQQRAANKEAQARAKLDEQRGLLSVRAERVKRLRDQYGKCKIVAPIDGVVQYPAEENAWRFGGNRVAAGEKAFEGQVLIVLPDTSQMVVSTRIHEADRHKVREGLPCSVKVPAVPGSDFTGRIEKIARFADSANRWLNPELKEHTTEILLDATAAPISPGDSAEVKIYIEEVPDVLAVPVQCVFSRGPKSYVFVRNGVGTAFAEIKPGRASESMIEVVEGLADGDQVLMHVSEQMLATLPTYTGGPGDKKAPVPAGAPVAGAAQPAAPAAPAAGATAAAAAPPKGG